MTLDGALVGFLAWARRGGMAAHTIGNYASAARIFAAFLELRRVSDLGAVDRRVVADFQSYLMGVASRRARPYATGSRWMVLAWLKKFFGYLVVQGHLLVDPTAGIKMPRKGHKLPRALMTADEMRRLLLAPDVGTGEGIQDRAMLEVLYGLGVRYSELVDLTVGDIQLQERILWVRQGKGRRDRVLPLGRWAAHWLDRHLAASDQIRRRLGTDRVFLSPRGGRLLNSDLNARLREYARRAGIAKPLTLHTIRHTFATLLLQGGADVRRIQRLLGHVMLATTQVYTHLDLEDLRRVQERCHPRERAARDPAAGE